MNAALNEELTLERVLSNPDTRTEWVKFQLALAGSNTSAIGREVGVTSQAVGMVIRGRFSNQKVEQKIAEKIGMPASRIWAERYPQQYQQSCRSARG